MSEIEIFIDFDNQKYNVKIKDSCTVADLKKEIKKLITRQYNDLYAMYNGKVLKDEDTLSSYNMENGGQHIYLLWLLVEFKSFMT